MSQQTRSPCVRHTVVPAGDGHRLENVISGVTVVALRGWTGWTVWQWQPKTAHFLECAPRGGQFRTAILTGGP